MNSSLRVLRPWPKPLALLLLLAGCFHAPPKPGLRMQGVKLTLDAYRLPSGMQVIIEEDHASPVVGVVAVVAAGNADDPVGKEGLAHLVEHLTYRARPDGKLQRRALLDFAAAGDVNATTDPDDTVYWAFGPARSLEGLIRIEANRLAAPLAHLDAATFEVERNVVLNELAQGDPGQRSSEIFTWLAQAAFPPGHPYARPPAGTATSLAHIQLEDAQAFAQAHYVPSQTTWVIAGDVTRDQVQALLLANLPQSAFAASSAPPTAAAPAAAPERALTVARHVSMGVTQPTLYLIWPLPPTDASTAVLDQFLAGAVEATADFWADADIKSASAFLVPGERASMLVCALTLEKGEHPDETAKRVTEKLDWLGKLDADFPTFYFHQVQALTVTSLGMQVESLRARSVMRAVYAQATHQPAALSSVLGAIQKLTPEEVGAFAKKYLTAERERRVMVVPNPQAALLRELSSEGARGGRASAGALGLWAQDRAAPELRATPEAAHVQYSLEATRALMSSPALAGASTFTLPSGLKVVALHRPGWPQITVELGMAGGVADAEPPGAGYLSQLAGLEHHDNGRPAQSGTLLEREVDRDMTRIRLTGGNGNLDNLLGMLDDQVEQIHLARFAIQGVQKSLTELLTQDDQRPASQAVREVRQALYGKGTFARWTQATVADSVDASEVNDWLEQVYQPHNATLAIVGDFDPATLRPTVEKWLGGWTGSGPPLSLLKVEWPKREGAQVIVKEAKDSAQESVRLACAGPATDARQALAYTLLGEVLADELDQAARQELGGSYGFHTRASWMRGGVAEVELWGAVENAKLEPVLSRLHHQWTLMGRIAPSERALNRARWSLASGYNLGLQTAPRLAESLVRAGVMGFEPTSVAALPDLLTSITARDVEAAAERCRADSALVLVGNPDVAHAGLKAIWR